MGLLIEPHNAYFSTKKKYAAAGAAAAHVARTVGGVPATLLGAIIVGVSGFPGKVTIVRKWSPM